MSEAKVINALFEQRDPNATLPEKAGELVILPLVTRLPIPADRVLPSALTENMTEVVLIGYDKDGKFYFAASEPDGPSVLWLLEQAKRSLLNAGE